MNLAESYATEFGALVESDRAGPAAPAARRFDVLVDAQCGNDWDELAADFHDVSYDQTATFSRLLWGEQRMSGIMLRHGHDVLAAARAAVITLPGLRRGLAYVRGGPLWRRRGHAADTDTYAAAVDAIREEYCVRRGHHLIVTPHFNPDFFELETEMLQRAGFRVLRKSADPNRYFVNVRIDQDQQMRSLDQGWRRNLKKALANGFEIEWCNAQADVDCFIALNRTMLKRKGFFDSGNVLRLPQLLRDLPASLRPKIVLARYRGQPVVGAAVVMAGDVAHYLYGASDDTMLPLKAGYALQWWIIEHLSRESVDWYDLGGESLSDGLRQFKRGLTGKQGRIVEANVEWELAGSRSARLLAEAIFAVRAAKRSYMKYLNG